MLSTILEWQTLNGIIHWNDEMVDDLAGRRGPTFEGRRVNRGATRVAIGAACRLYGLSPRAIRFYEERGLLKSQRDPQGVRWFDAGARARLEWIALLRRGDVSLERVGRVLEEEERSAGGARAALEALAARKQELEAQLLATIAVLGEMERRKALTDPDCSKAVANGRY